MNQPLLVLDCHYLCHRAFHTTQGLSWKQKPTGVIFGFLRSIAALKDEFQTDRIAFCFEHPKLFRRDFYPAYKQKRMTRKKDPEEIAASQELHVQINALRTEHLPKIGFRNIFSIEGMESDDIMAALALEYSEDEDVILVTADGDLFQCLKYNVTIYNPAKQKLLTETWFRREYGIQPIQWAKVKAIAGCRGDEVQGIRGVGEKTALKYFRDELSPNSKAFRSITCSAGRDIRAINLRLVRLPFTGCPIPQLFPDKISTKGWKEVCIELGMKSMVHSHPPVWVRKLAKQI